MQIPIKNSIPFTNRAQILNLILENGAMSRIDLANTMKVTKASITLITNDMIQNELLYEKGIEPQSKKVTRGRRKILLDINENAKLAFGVVLEKDYLLLGLTNLKGETLDKRKISLLEKSYYDILSSIVEEIDSLKCVNCLSKNRILGLGVCIGNGGGALIDGVSIYDKLLKVKKDLARAIDLPIYTNTVVNGAILAQTLFTDKRPLCKNLLMLRYGNAIESGVLINGELYFAFGALDSKKPATNHELYQYSGGFAQMQCPNADLQVTSFTSYLDTIQASDEDGQDELRKLLLSNLSDNINTCYTVLLPEAIYVFGSFFESDNNLSWINKIFETNYRQKLRIDIGVVSESTLHLCACATVIKQCFYRNGGKS